MRKIPSVFPCNLVAARHNLLCRETGGDGLVRGVTTHVDVLTDG